MNLSVYDFFFDFSIFLYFLSFSLGERPSAHLQKRGRIHHVAYNLTRNKVRQAILGLYVIMFCAYITRVRDEEMRRSQADLHTPSLSYISTCYYYYTFHFFILINYLHFASQLCSLQSLIPRGDEGKIKLMYA